MSSTPTSKKVPVKQLWRMTRAEHRATVMYPDLLDVVTNDVLKLIYDASEKHRAAVKEALRAKRPIRADVLADYPGLISEVTVDAKKEREKRLREVRRHFKEWGPLWVVTRDTVGGGTITEIFVGPYAEQAAKRDAQEWLHEWLGKTTTPLTAEQRQTIIDLCNSNKLGEAASLWNSLVDAYSIYVHPAVPRIEA